MENNMEVSWTDNIINYFRNLGSNPLNLVSIIVDIAIVLFLAYCFVRVVKGSRAWQLIKGIIFLVIATWLSGVFKLTILNTILT